MQSAQRRAAVLSVLERETAPVSATALARRFGVSRQIIVGDVALLRASGAQIDATPRGYVLSRPASGGVKRQIACVHSAEDMVRELNICVDHGCAVLDVIVEHPVYGQLTGPLRLRSRHDVGQFLAKAEGASPLSVLTDGIHLHTVRCPDRETLRRVTQALRQEGFLLESGE